MTTFVTMPSLFVKDKIVKIDTSAANPILSDLYQAAPDGYRAAAARQSEPSFFTNSDLPEITASGLPPEKLATLPANVRHGVAEMSDLAQVYAAYEQYASDPAAFLASPGQDAAVQRISDWYAAGNGGLTPQQDADQAEVVLEALFGEKDKAAQAKAIADRAAQADDDAYSSRTGRYAPPR